MKPKMLACIAAAAFTLSPGLAMAGPGGHSQGHWRASYPQLADVSPQNYRHGAQNGGGSNTLPVDQIEQILDAQGSMSNGVLALKQNRGDLSDLDITVSGEADPSIQGIPLKMGFELPNQFFFQPIGHGQAILNANLPLRPASIQPFIDKLLANGLVFQSFHQHFYDLKPMIFFIHYRGVGDPIQLAHAVADAVSATGTPIPQPQTASKPTTPLNAQKLAQILDGSAQVGSNGVVVVTIPRRNGFILGGVHAKTELGLETNVQFEPLGGGQTAVSPDFAMTAPEVEPTIKVMRKQGFVIECLYNQETDEFPQLYFSHQLKVGDAYALAREVRQGLDQINAKGSPATTKPNKHKDHDYGHNHGRYKHIEHRK